MRPITLIFALVTLAFAELNTALGSETTQSTNRASLWRSAISLGVNEDVLASLGTSGGQASAFAARLSQYEGEIEELDALRIALAERNAEIHEYEARLRRDPQDSGAQTGLDEAQGSRLFYLGQIELQRAALLDWLGAELVDVAELETLCRDSSEYLRLPAPYRFAADTAEEARAIAWALRVEERAQDAGVSVPQDAAGLLAQVRSETAVANALAALDARLAEVESAVDTWLAGE